MMQTLIDIVYGLQIELFLFVFAALLHIVLFRHDNLAQMLSLRTKPSKASKVDTADKDKASNGPDAGASLTRRLESMAANGHSSQALAAEWTNLLQAQSGTCTTHVVTRTLEGLGRNANAELLAALREVMITQGIGATPQLHELLLRNYMRLRLMDDFNALFSEIEASSVELSPAIALLALKAALRTSNIDDVLQRFKGSKANFQDRTLSSVPETLLQQVGRLAVSKKAADKFLMVLFSTGFSNEVIQIALKELVNEASKDTDLKQEAKLTALLQSIEKLLKEHNVPSSPAVYAALLKAYGNTKDGLRLLAEAAAAGVARGELLTAAADVAGSHGKAGAPLMAEVLKQLSATSPTPPLAVAVIKALPCALAAAQQAKGSDTSAAPWSALRLYEVFFHGVDLPDFDVLKLVASEACDKPEELKSLLSSVADKTKMVALIKHFGVQHELTKAQTIFEACEAPTNGLSNAFLEACVECCDAQAARKTMDQAMSLGIADVASHNTLLKAFLKAGDFKGARGAMDSMRSHGISPNSVTYNELLDASFAHNSGGAWSVLEEMEAAGIQPNHVTCSILLKNVTSKSGGKDLERTMQIFDSMSEEVDEVLVSSLMEACIRAGRSDLLKPRLRRQKTSKKVLIRGPHAYGSLIRAFGYVHDLEGVWAMWRDMRTRHVPLSSVTVGCMVEALVSNGDPSAGLELIHDILADEKSKGVINAVIYCSVLKGFSHQKKFESAWAVYEEMRQNNIDLPIATYNALVDACARSNEMVRVQGLLKDMQASNIEPNLITYSSIVKGYCQENKLEKAFELLETMKETTNLKPDEIMYNSLLDGCTRQNLYDRGMSVIKQMEKDGIALSNYTLSILVKLACRSRRIEEAFAMCKQIPQKYHFQPNVHVYNNLIQGCVQARQNGRAFTVFEQMLEAGVRADTRTYKLLVQGFSAAGDWLQAGNLVRTALSLPRGHPGLARFGVTLLCPQDRFTPALLSEMTSPIIKQNKDEVLALDLLQDLKLHVPGFSTDPKVALHVASRAAQRR